MHLKTNKTSKLNVSINTCKKWYEECIFIRMIVTYVMRLQFSLLFLGLKSVFLMIEINNSHETLLLKKRNFLVYLY